LRRFPAADVIVKAALAWLRDIGKRPFFLWLHLMDPHGPYYPAEPALDWMGDSRTSPVRAFYLNQYWNRRELGADRLRKYRDDIVRLYDAGIRWVDAQLATFIDGLKVLGLWNDSVLAFTADHGEEFLDHGSRFHPQWTCKEELIHVPLVIRFPGLRECRRDEVFSHVDLAPTLLDAVGVPVPAQFQGHSRWNHPTTSREWDGPAVVDCTESVNPYRSEERLRPRVLCIREQRYKLAIKFGTTVEELYDLESDPGEFKPISRPEGTDIRRRLLAYARQHLVSSVQLNWEEYRIRNVLRNFHLKHRLPSLSAK
jgi:arylsulfatase A-like enzyme